MRPAIFLCLAACLALLGSASARQLPAGEAAARRPSAWLVYWDLEAAGPELEMVREAGGTLSYFAAYYDASDSPFLDRDALERFLSFRERGLADRALLAVVNDRQGADGVSVLKDAALAARLFRDERAMRKEAVRLSELAALHGFAGLDMDFENLGEQNEPWRRYAAFLKILYEEASSRGLSLRVTVEPGALGRADYPLGPNYAVMLYNLYGTHSSPGPKADFAFIRDTLARALEAFGPGVQAALAAGGFVWGGDGRAEALTEDEALGLLASSGCVASRDEGSGALHFTYREQTGDSREVWFADGQTLAGWARACREAGVSSLALWRLGGNNAASLRAYLAEASLE